MCPDAMVYEGTLNTCDQSINLVLTDACEKRSENGAVATTPHEIVMLRGDQVCFIALDDGHAAHFAIS
jgi:small nuclear ribonucleoprotein (snRNP)-like protein